MKEKKTAAETQAEDVAREKAATDDETTKANEGTGRTATRASRKEDPPNAELRGLRPIAAPNNANPGEHKSRAKRHRAADYALAPGMSRRPATRRRDRPRPTKKYDVSGRPWNAAKE